ncbi:MAG: hypothetical protein ACRDS0_35545 [Pseudonocardiaceae bacterium]
MTEGEGELLPTDPMVGLDPWTAGWIDLRKFVESGHRTAQEITDRCEAIRATLPYPDPPPEIALVIQADITLLEMNAPDTPLTPTRGKLWTPPPTEEE